MSTCDANRPGTLRLRGKATFTSEPDSTHGIDIWCGIWEIDGGQAQIRVGDIEFWGNKFKDAFNTRTNSAVGAGLAVLKLTGDGVSTIHAQNVDFVDAAVLDVSGLKIPGGTCRVIDGAAISGTPAPRRGGGTNLRFAPETDTGKWSFKFDRANGDLMLTFTP